MKIAARAPITPAGAIWASGIPALLVDDELDEVEVEELEALEVAPEEDPELEAPVVLAADPEEVLPLVAEAEEPAEVETAWPIQLESELF